VAYAIILVTVATFPLRFFSWQKLWVVAGQYWGDGQIRNHSKGSRIMAKCAICGKKPMTGHNVSHSMRHTKRQWKPNLQKTTIFEAGKARKVKVCSRCLRSMTKT
jgi:large subunit ribosomal protein L28